MRIVSSTCRINNVDAKIKFSDTYNWACIALLYVWNVMIAHFRNELFDLSSALGLSARFNDLIAFFSFLVTTLLLCFSLPRNWYKLTTETQNSELSRDLRSINAFRTICMFGVICAHCALANNMCPQLNPYYIEAVWQRFNLVLFFFYSNV